MYKTNVNFFTGIVVSFLALGTSTKDKVHCMQH